ncbi:MAG: gamma-glutamyltransferase [Candidatus Heimdallarchaeota archaeon]|nr:gamma-glutamyltransferase [Candidatus Heimdallarchaeota archaeon]
MKMYEFRASHRSMIVSKNGMVASSQPLAVQAGIDILKKGGNAIDAAIAVATTLNVVEPMSTGIGGDAFALIYSKKDNKLHALNASGWSSENSSIDFFKNKEMDEIPLYGIHSISVPGAVSGFEKALEEFGTMSLKEVLQPAIYYAENGFPVSELIAFSWNRAEQKLNEYPSTAKTYLPNGSAPKVGDIHYSKDIANTFKLIAKGGAEEFYKGSIAKKIITYCNANGGYFTADDFASFEAEWVQPISSNYKDYDVYQCPPNGQGIAILLGLNIVKGFELDSMIHNSAQYLHLLIEAKKLAWADLRTFASDPHFNNLPVDELLSEDYSIKQRNRIDLNKAAENIPPGLDWSSGDTVYLSVVDKDRNVVSFINSLYNGFGSGHVAEGTGICLQNRGSLFSLDPKHLNSLQPRKRPFHTIIPGMVMQNGLPVLNFGCMGGDVQPQGQMQIFLNLIEFNMNIQQAIEAPRFRHYDDNHIALERGINEITRAQLLLKGHKIGNDIGEFFGGAQGIAIDNERDVLFGGSDLRRDGSAIGY